MTELRPTPVMVTLVQAATSLPVFLFALPAGAVGDLVDRRGLSIVLQVASATLAMALALSTLLGFTTPG
jgi:MFS family permease